MADVLVWLQVQGGALHAVSRESIACARQLAQESGGRAYGVCVCAFCPETLLREMQDCGLCEVDIYESPDYRVFFARSYANALVSSVRRLQPAAVLVGATLEGRALAPTAASLLQTGVTADCTALAWDENGLLLQTRPAFGGDVMAEIITPTARPQIATVRGAVLPWQGLPQQGETKLSRYSVEMGALPGVLQPQATQAEAAREDIILALGGALREKEELAFFSALCEKLGAGLYGSRSLVQRGWLPQTRQIGLSGCSVAPKLLIALGISGSVQFLAGITQARRVVAVNTDENAPILRRADVPLVGDLFSISRILYEAENL